MMRIISQITLNIAPDGFTVYHIGIAADEDGNTGGMVERRYTLDRLPAFEAELKQRGYKKHSRSAPGLCWYQRVEDDRPRIVQIAQAQQHRRVIDKAMARKKRA